ncbi:PucR C-terminal helix-turn-helix domain-containing protein [Quadrisphaera granulorum]|uniref:PucR-like helix-turn-helix protein n=1 Tax=Quadrisphaera granulorum TaxID=317664 RepID=A0A316AET9_9ACTN|nr:helix-turn-helix domain-containing protein [Quadrisphaera granulorum]PWJ48297.1 PucR-like helix-turn-helix protein [Quadrisphaera granulorum]SZE98458.1 PucR C-terminal helix-turn-helix domain-containing protein [Quadrisphaera granulorum]
MQDLLGRLEALDPDASHGLRVIACFDELLVGNVGTRGLLSAAAAMAGCPAGFQLEGTSTCLRVASTGTVLESAPAPEGTRGVDGVLVWLERDGSPGGHDALILERLVLALRIRHGRGRAVLAERRHMAVLLDRDVPVACRRQAASALRIRTDGRHRVVVAPLFAQWTSHPVVPEDVVPTPHGPLHVLVVPEGHAPIPATPSGASQLVAVDDLPRALQTAITALRLWDAAYGPTSHAERFGGLLELLVDLPEDADTRDVDRLEALAALPWGASTLAALTEATSVRHAARLAHVHHSTLHGRLEEVVEALGFDPLAGLGRARLSVAWLRWRLRHSRVLDLPAPRRASEAPTGVGQASTQCPTGVGTAVHSHRPGSPPAMLTPRNERGGRGRVVPPRTPRS